MQKLNAKILVIDDDADILTAARIVLRQSYETVDTESNPQKINYLISHKSYDVILLDMNFSAGKTNGREGIEWLRQILISHPQQQVVMITAYGDIRLAVDAMKEGAADFVVKPWDNEKLEATVLASWKHALSLREVSELKSRQSHINRVMSATDSDFIGNAPATRDVLESVRKVAATDANVLLLGENGTGKELIAKQIHQQSGRRDMPFVTIDAGSIAPTLFESELFGHKRGAFTDAREDRIGRLELAHGGTLFLDEIGNLPLPLQMKLLSALQSREVTPVGAGKPVPIDVRVISATNINIHEAVNSGLFREDLLYRINTVEITLPPLRTRMEDIPILAQHFLSVYATKYKREKVISPEVIQHLQKYSWPGNVRELQHAMERAVIMSEQRMLQPRDFPLSPRRAQEREQILNLDQMEKNAIVAAMHKHQGNISKVAKELGVGRTTLYRKMTKYGLANPE